MQTLYSMLEDIASIPGGEFTLRHGISWTSGKNLWSARFESGGKNEKIRLDYEEGTAASAVGRLHRRLVELQLMGHNELRFPLIGYSAEEPIVDGPEPPLEQPPPLRSGVEEGAASAVKAELVRCGKCHTLWPHHDKNCPNYDPNDEVPF